MLALQTEPFIECKLSVMTESVTSATCATEARLIIIEIYKSSQSHACIRRICQDANHFSRLDKSTHRLVVSIQSN